MSDPALVEEESPAAIIPLPLSYVTAPRLIEHPGPRPGTRAYDPHRAINAFPPEADAEFKALLDQAPGRRRKNAAEVRDGILWFTNPNRPCVTSAEQNSRHWWKSTFRYCPLQDCLFAKPSAKHALERKVVTEEDYFHTILYEHDINGPRGHEATSKALLQRYYGPTRQDALEVLKKCLTCSKKMPEQHHYPTPPEINNVYATESYALRQISHGPVPLSGIPLFETAEEKRQWQLHHMAAAFRYFARQGFVEGMSGHISVRDPEHPQAFWMNPIGRHFGLLKASDMMLIDMATGQIVGGNRSRPANAAGFMIHKAVHLSRPDVHAVCHAHSIHGRAYSCFAKPLDMITQDVCNFYDAHGVYNNYGGVVLGEEEGLQIASALGNGKGCILMNHGLLTVGTTVDEAAFLFGLMERSCQIQLLADAAEREGKPKKLIGDAEAQYNFRVASEPDSLYAEFQGDYEYEEVMSYGDFKH